MGPGWIVMLADVDAPSILTAMQSGYYLGYLMIPWLILITIPLYFIQELTIRLAIGSGKGIGEVLKERYGELVALASLAAMVVIDGAAYIGEYSAIAAVGLMLGMPVAVSILLAITLHSLIIAFSGRYRAVENMLLAISALILVYLAAFAVFRLDYGGVAQAFSAMFSPKTYSPGYVTLLAANIGAAVMPWMLYYQSSAIVDKGLKPQHYTHERFETAIGAIVSEVLMIAGVIVGYVIRARGGDVDGFESALKSIMGIMGAGWFYAASIGLIAAALLAIFVISMGFAYGFGEFLGRSGFRNRFSSAKEFYIFYLIEVVPAAVIVLASPDLARLIIDIMVFNSIALAIPLILLVKLTSDRGIVGGFAIGKARACVLYALALIVLALGIYAIV